MSRVSVCVCRLEPKEATPRKRAASTTASGKPRAKRTSASRQRLIAAELQELDRLDREMRGEIRSRKLRTTLTPQERPAARSRVKEMVKQAQNIWDQIYSEVRTGRGGSSVSCVGRERGVVAAQVPPCDAMDRYGYSTCLGLPPVACVRVTPVWCCVGSG